MNEGVEAGHEAQVREHLAALPPAARDRLADALRVPTHRGKSPDVRALAGALLAAEPLERAVDALPPDARAVLLLAAAISTAGGCATVQQKLLADRGWDAKRCGAAFERVFDSGLLRRNGPHGWCVAPGIPAPRGRGGGRGGRGPPRRPRRRRCRSRSSSRPWPRTSPRTPRACAPTAAST